MTATEEWPLTELVERYRPESHGRNETWTEHAARLWRDEPEWMRQLAALMADGGWVYGPVIVDDGVVQDGHHRVVTALHLGWHTHPIPVTAAP